MKRNEYVVEETRFDYKGYSCVVLFTDMGHRCGYVGIPTDKLTFDPEEMLGCHGSVTYCHDYLQLQDDEGITWAGFDTAHCDDGKDLEKLGEYFGEEAAELMRKYTLCTGTVRSLEYCIEQCKSMVDQTIDILEGNDESN